MGYPTKHEALKQAAATADLMKTDGWVTDIWKNTEWHFHLRNRFLILFTVKDHPRKGSPTRYCAMVSNREPAGGGLSVWTDSKYFKDPNRAVTYAVNNIRPYVANVVNVLETCDAILATAKAKKGGRR